ncbi:hypothetical protein [Chondromyces crocatus]|uniref:hypothetical protein n=1 Tax=Chondromyces crocatus TaxID=52 RepID=UPI0012E0DCD4|nr:hypothetical protein [Chondromyces crocatus]
MAALVAGLLALLGPGLVIRWVLIPLGLARLAFHATSLADWVFAADRRGGAVLAGAWALSRSRRHDEDTAAWLEEKLVATVPWVDPDELAKAALGEAEPVVVRMIAPLRGAGIAALALLTAHRGDRAGARALFESLSFLDERACPSVARQVATRWLAAEAASRGDWERVAALCPVRLWQSGDARLLGAVARRLLAGAEGASDLPLWLYWLMAPHHAATLPLVRRALGPRFERDEPAASPELHAVPVVEGDLWGRAVALHATTLLKGDGGVSGEDLRRLGGAWDAVFDEDAAVAEVRVRAQAIGATRAEVAVAAMRGAVIEDMVSLIRGAGIPRAAWEDLGETLSRSHRRLRDELLAELELIAGRLRERVDEARELPAPDEWRAWMALRARYEEAASLAGMELRRLAFPKVNSDVCHLAVWLFNQRGQRALSNGMFRWLLAEAEAVGDERAAELARKNLDCGV